MSDPAAGLDAEARRRVSLAVRAGDAVTDPHLAPAAGSSWPAWPSAAFEARTLGSALRISAGVVLAWLLLVALPVTVSTGVHLAALAAGVGVGALLFSVILLLGRRQLRLARRAEQRNLSLMQDGL